MDELLIEDKKYVSSKRAAKITGYAKDYVGQLCREGRVPARLVGRSWYVLESAIQDHRFGNPEVTRGESIQPPSPSTWEAPRYEASEAELLPVINRLQTTESSNDKEKESEFSQHLQDSWRAWFDRVGDIEPIPPVTAPEPEDKEVNIPIRTVYKAIYQAPPEELLPHRTRIEDEQENQPVHIKKSKPRLSRGVIRTIQVAGIVLALITSTIAVIGSGYFDTYILSNRQVSIISGIILYNR